LGGIPPIVGRISSLYILRMVLHIFITMDPEN